MAVLLGVVQCPAALFLGHHLRRNRHKVHFNCGTFYGGNCSQLFHLRGPKMRSICQKSLLFKTVTPLRKIPAACRRVTAMSTAPAKATITHVIFDMDGLLLDTEGFYTEVQEKILHRFGKTFDWSLKPKMMGKKALESAHIFVDESGLNGLLTAEEFLVEREDLLQELFPTCNLMPGVERLVNHLLANGIPMCVGTGSHQRHFTLKTRKHGEIFSKMHHVVKGDDPEVKKGKPSPDIFVVAAKRFEEKVDPHNILVFEDAPTGVAAAKSAGMWAVMVPDPRLDSCHHKDADQVISSLLDFQPREWGIPPFQDVAR